jgi:hypothetical protein
MLDLRPDRTGRIDCQGLFQRSHTDMFRVLREDSGIPAEALQQVDGKGGDA